jgi:hypothetical protein
VLEVESVNSTVPAYELSDVIVTVEVPELP